jgi:hypothetical protein
MYVLVVFATRGAPPNAAALNGGRAGVSFSPLFQTGNVYSVDRTVWQPGEAMPREPADSFVPSQAAISGAMDFSGQTGCHLMFGLTTSSTFNPPGSTNEKVELLNVEKAVDAQSLRQCVEIGFDVVDQWTGISALANIGYSQADISTIRNLRLKTTPFGLLESIQDATALASAASALVSEHAPFIPVRVLARLRAADAE